MPIVNITDSQAAILEKVYAKAHDIMYHGVASTSNPAFMPVNEDYKDLIDSPPAVPGISAASIEEDTKSGAQTASTALVVAAAPTIVVAKATANNTVSAASPKLIVSQSITFNSKKRNILILFQGYATSSLAASLSLQPIVSGTPSGDVITFTVATTGTVLYGAWNVVTPDAEAATIAIRAHTTDLVETFTLNASSNQIMSVYG